MKEILKKIENVFEDTYWVRDLKTNQMKKYDDTYLKPKDDVVKEPTAPYDIEPDASAKQWLLSQLPKEKDDAGYNQCLADIKNILGA